MSSNVKVAVAQLNCTVGDFEGNSRRILDAARRAAAALAGDARVAAWQVRVAHFESLHPHDAVASVGGRNP